MFVLDTNVVSELMKPHVDPNVETWFASHARDSLYTTTITQAEILYGIAILPDGARQQRLQTLAQLMFQEDFAGKLLPFDPAAASYYAALSSHRRARGIPISQFDAQIAAICQAHQAAIVTRNVDDFVHCDLKIINPWE
ncbi:putative nucleic acid-binding protein [Leptolyngbya sp. PCC 7375]|nr:putative nucleic acid-binding protein [Leptolyngbya sp. PCC 7375]